MLENMSSVVLEVGHAILKMRETDAVKGEWYGSQLKTKADVLAHDMMSELLALVDATIPVVSEEDSSSQEHARPDRYWLIDPIDGTASFAEGFSGFVTQVALMENEQPVLAAIYAPALEQLYLASHGGGTTLNGKVLTVTSEQGRRSLIDNYPEPRGTTAAVFNELNFSEYVECGGISLKMCRIADGSADVFFKDVIIRDWDIAAPHLVLIEAGGSLVLSNGKNVSYNGSYEKKGLVAARSVELCEEITTWFAENITMLDH